MIHGSRTRCRAPVMLAALTLLAGCAREVPTPFRLGLSVWPGYEFLYLAQEKGFFRDEDLEVRVVEFSSLSDARRAYERGQLNALGTTPVEVLQIRDVGKHSPQIVQVLDYSNGGDVILARPGFAGLRHARIGVELASLGLFVLARGLDRAGLGLADVTTVSSDQPTMTTGLHAGDFDAVVTYAPWSTRMLRDTPATTVFSSADIPGEVLDVLAVEAGLVTKRPGEVAKLLRAHSRARAWAEQQPAEGYAVMAAREGTTPGELRATFARDVRLVTASEQGDYLRPGSKLADLLEVTDRVLRQIGQLNGRDRRDGAFTAAFVEPRVAP